MNKEQLFRKLYSSLKERDSYVEKIPPDLLQCVTMNDYCNRMQDDLDYLMRVVFDEHWYSIEWFLYSWFPGATVCLSEDDEEIAINSIDEYIEWLKENEGFGE